MNPIPTLLLASALVLLSIAAHADSRNVEAQAVPVESAEGMVEIEIPKTEAELRLLAILEDGRIEVEALSARLASATDPAEIRSIQLEIGAAKSATRVRFLEEHIVIAEEQGDEAKRSEAQDQLDQLRARLEGRDQTMPLIDRPQGGSR